MKRLLAILSLAGLICAGCGGGSAKRALHVAVAQPTQAVLAETDCHAVPDKKPPPIAMLVGPTHHAECARTLDARRLLGTSVKAAKSRAAREGYESRIVKRDGHAFLVTMDYERDRH